MGKVKIIADSTCDLSKDLIEKYDITIIPLCIILGDESYFDGENLKPDDIYDWVGKNGKTPKTAAIPIESATKTILQFIEQKKDIIFFGISEDMSTTCNIMRLIGEDLNYKRLFVINSENLSTGIGLQVLKAAQMAQEGIEAEEIVEEIEKIRERVSASFVIDTLEYLAKGGRCSSVTALLASALKIKPMIEVKKGKMGVGRKYRGSQKKVIQSYVKDLEKDLLTADPAMVFITHSGCDEKTVNEVKDFLIQLDYFDHIYVTRAGGVISSHCGPNTLGVLFIKK